MATVEPYGTAQGKRYRVRYRKPDHSQTTKRGFKTKREAELYLAEVEIGKASGSYIDPLNARAKIGDLGDMWMSSQIHLKPSSTAVVESAWRLHVKPRWGSLAVGEVRHTDVQAWVSQLSLGIPGKSKPKSAALVHRAHGVLAGIFDAAARDRRVDSNPARGISLPRRVPREHRYLTHRQVHSLAEECGEHGTLIRLLSYTGLRWGEATALRCRDIDFTRGRVSVIENAVLVRGHVIVGTPKTHKRRSVPFPAFLAPALKCTCDGKVESALVFGDAVGDYLTTPTTKARSWLDQALSKAGLPSMTIHDLRHTAVSLAISAGANVKAIQKMVGHASAAMTLDTYAELFDDDLNSVAVRLNDAAIATDVVKVWSATQKSTRPWSSEDAESAVVIAK
jgi:integrase